MALLQVIKKGFNMKIVIKRLIALSFLLWPLIAFSELYYVGAKSIEYQEPVQISGIATPNTLIMSPAIYGFNGPNYDCTAEGLYRYYVVNTNYAQRIVYNGDIDKLIISLSWVHAHGYKDDNLTYANALSASTTRKLQMTCGSISTFVSNVLTSQNITNRQVLLLTLDTWNSYNNGHTVIEVFSNNKWQMWDIDHRNRISVRGNYLNALQFANCVQSDAYYYIDRFSHAPKFAYGDLLTSGYDYTFWYEEECLLEPNIRDFYKRCAQLVLINANGFWWFTTNDPNVRTRVESYDSTYKYVDQATWLSTFYP
jgi:hypothetical protein